MAEHLAYVLLAEERILSGEPPGEPPWGDDLGDYTARLVMSLGGDPERLLGRPQPRGISPDRAGRRIREQVAEELKLLGASRRELLAIIGGKNPTSIRKLVRDAEARRDLRRYLRSLDLDSGLARERAAIKQAHERAERDEP